MLSNLFSSGIFADVYEIVNDLLTVLLTLRDIKSEKKISSWKHLLQRNMLPFNQNKIHWKSVFRIFPQTRLQFHAFCDWNQYVCLWFMFLVQFLWRCSLLWWFWDKITTTKITARDVKHICMSNASTSEVMIEKNFTKFFMFFFSRCERQWAFPWNMKINQRNSSYKVLFFSALNSIYIIELSGKFQQKIKWNKVKCKW